MKQHIVKWFDDRVVDHASTVDAFVCNGKY